MKSGKNPFKNDPFLASAMGLGTQFAVAMVFGALGGFYADKEFETSPLWLLLGIFLALIYMVYEVWKVIRINDKKETKKLDDDNKD